MSQVIIKDAKSQDLLKNIIQDFLNNPDNIKKMKAFSKNPDIAGLNLSDLFCHYSSLEKIETQAKINRINGYKPHYTFSDMVAATDLYPVLKDYQYKPGWEQFSQDINDLIGKINR